MHTLESATRTLRFSVFEVDLRAAELRKHGVRIKLQDQPFRILSRLLENHGDIVTREELRQDLWHDHTFVDFDRSLNKAMAKLRSALGDSGDTSKRFRATAIDCLCRWSTVSRRNSRHTLNGSGMRQLMILPKTWIFDLRRQTSQAWRSLHSFFIHLPKVGVFRF